MFKKTVIAAALVAVAAPAFAMQPVTAGSEQLARSLGVEAGAFTTAQLIELKNARDDDNSLRFGQILRGEVGVSARQEVEFGGHNAVATDFLVRQLREEGEFARANAIESGSTSTGTASDRGIVTPGKIKLAGTVGVDDPAAYTTAELAMLATRMNENSEN